MPILITSGKSTWPKPLSCEMAEPNSEELLTPVPTLVRFVNGTFFCFCVYTLKRAMPLLTCPVSDVRLLSSETLLRCLTWCREEKEGRLLTRDSVRGYSRKWWEESSGDSSWNEVAPWETMGHSSGLCQPTWCLFMISFYAWCFAKAHSGRQSLFTDSDPAVPWPHLMLS